MVWGKYIQNILSVTSFTTCSARKQTTTKGVLQIQGDNTKRKKEKELNDLQRKERRQKLKEKPRA